jgi:hypothetical protein
MDQRSITIMQTWFYTALLVGGLTLFMGCSAETLTQNCFATSSARTASERSGEEGEESSESASGSEAVANSSSGCDHTKSTE